MFSVTKIYVSRRGSSASLTKEKPERVEIQKIILVKGNKSVSHLMIDFLPTVLEIRVDDA